MRRCVTRFEARASSDHPITSDVIREAITGGLAPVSTTVNRILAPTFGEECTTRVKDGVAKTVESVVYTEAVIRRLAVEERRVKSAGGFIVRPKFSIGGHGFVSIITDTESNMLGLHSVMA